MRQTENYGLPQWEAADRLLRSDFNDAFSAVDAALASLAGGNFIMGSYVGDGDLDGKFVELPFTPRLLLLFGYLGTSASSQRIDITTDSLHYMISNGGGLGHAGYNAVTIVENGFKTCDVTNHNVSGKPEYYIAFR